jgi:hypothetical protein
VPKPPTGKNPAKAPATPSQTPEEPSPLPGAWSPRVPPGHYYSPIPSIEEVKRKEAAIFGDVPPELPGIDLNVSGQLAWFDRFAPFYPQLPFGEQRKPGLRYFYENDGFNHTDAIALYCLIRHAKPNRIIEAGSGNSSALILDVNESYFDNAISYTIIDPYPDGFHSVSKPGDQNRVRLIPKRLQDVDLVLFRDLSANDILFIDSSHVSKIDSDVNFVVFKVLPLLERGVFIHFHDVFYPFEYPKEWVYEGRAWNEAYLLRAFLQHNNSFQIQFFPNYLGRFHGHRFENDMPLCVRNSGCSLWIRKV